MLDSVTVFTDDLLAGDALDEVPTYTETHSMKTMIRIFGKIVREEFRGVLRSKLNAGR